MELRPYQSAAVTAALKSLAVGEHPALQLATGTGKSLIIAAIAHEFDGPVWVLTHIQQLIKQNAKAYVSYSGDNRPGIVCAGLNTKCFGRVTFASVQTLTGMLSEINEPPGLIIIDEAHRVPHFSGEGGLYEGVLSAHPGAARIAMTATPWRMDNGLIYGNGEHFWFDRLAYSYTVPQAVADGWLAPLVGVDTEVQLDVEHVTVNDDYVQKEVEKLQTEEWLRSVAQSLVRLGGRRKHIAVYCPTIDSAYLASAVIADITGWTTSVITGKTPQAERENKFQRFAAGTLKAICSVDTLTTGFDFPALDCIACLRPTVSSSLWVQIQGRGTRLAPGKKNCLVLDYVGNLQRLGGVGMYDTYVRERGGEAVAEVEAEPIKRKTKRERRQLPGLTKLKPVDPLTGEEALEGVPLKVAVHSVTAVPIVPRGKSEAVLLVQYVTTTPENARINASRFVDTQKPRTTDLEFFTFRRLAVNLPAPASSTVWQVRNGAQPAYVTVTKRGRYWNVVAEHF